MSSAHVEKQVEKQVEKGERFQALHRPGNCFVIPNPWDAGTAKMLAARGFKALATTSAGLAFALGRSDGHGAVSSGETLANARDIVKATDLPVSADLENGWSADPKDVAVVIDRAVRVGLVGGSIEDSTGDTEEPIYDFGLAVDRIRAAAEAARRKKIPFMLTARAENFLHGRPDLSDTIRRLQAFQEAGADVLYAPGLRSKADIASVVSSVDRPVNVVMGLAGFEGSVQDLAEMGVTRISVGSSLARAALGAFDRAASEVLKEGTFNYAGEALPYGELNGLFRSR